MKSFEIKACGLEELTLHESTHMNGGFWEIGVIIGVVVDYLIHLHDDKQEVREMEELARQMYNEDKGK